MKFLEIHLPSNRKFGFFFSGVFAALGAHFYLENSVIASYLFFVLAIVFFITTLLKADALRLLNKLWMLFGLLLGLIVSPIILGFIFFGLFTPMSIFMRLFRRDELRLNFKNKTSHWILRDPSTTDTYTFQYQF